MPVKSSTSRAPEEPVTVRPLPQPTLASAGFWAAGGDGVLRTLVTAAFSHRRKTLRNSLKGLLSAQDIRSCGIDPQLRPESLAPAQFGLLATHYSQMVGYTRTA